MNTISKIIKLKSSERGFSMIETMITLFVAGIITAAAFGVYVTQHEQLIEQDDVAELQGNARVVAERLGKEIRKAGFNLPPFVAPIEVTRSWPDTLIIRYAKDGFYGIETTETMETGYSDIYCPGIYFRDLMPGDYVYIYEATGVMGELINVTDVDYETGRIGHSRAPLSRPYPAGSKLCKVEKVKFYLDRADYYNPKLIVQKLGGPAEIYAENIESIYFMYHLSNGYAAPNFNNPYDVRMVEINVTSRSEHDMHNYDNYYSKSRSYSLKVNLRNMGLS